MSDSREIVPTKTLVKHGTTATVGLVGGAALLILQALGPIGGVIGAVLALGGFGVAAASKEDRVAGLVVGAAGTLAALAGFGVFGSGLLVFSGIGLLIAGGFSLFKFFKGLRSRR